MRMVASQAASCPRPGQLRDREAAKHHPRLGTTGDPRRPLCRAALRDQLRRDSRSESERDARGGHPEPGATGDDGRQPSGGPGIAHSREPRTGPAPRAQESAIASELLQRTLTLEGLPEGSRRSR